MPRFTETLLGGQPPNFRQNRAQNDPILRKWKITLRLNTKLQTQRVRRVIINSLPMEFFDPQSDPENFHLQFLRSSENKQRLVCIESKLKPCVWGTTTRGPLGIGMTRLNKLHSVAAIRKRLQQELEKNYENNNPG